MATSVLDRVVMAVFLDLNTESSIEDWIRADRIYQWVDIVSVLWFIVSWGLVWKLTSGVENRWREVLSQPSRSIPDV